MVFTPNILNTLILAIISILSDTSKEWYQRKEWLRRIQVYCTNFGIDPIASDALIQNLPNLHEPLSIQVHDLRSSITKETCITIWRLCEVLKGVPDLDKLVNHLLTKECLIKQLNSGNKTVSSIVDDWIEAVLRTTKWPKFVSWCQESIKTYKSAYIHSRMAYYLEIFI